MGIYKPVKIPNRRKVRRPVHDYRFPVKKTHPESHERKKCGDGRVRTVFTGSTEDYLAAWAELNSDRHMKPISYRLGDRVVIL